jgi:F-type H+-transporting ATPase subunit b
LYPENFRAWFTKVDQVPLITDKESRMLKRMFMRGMLLFPAVLCGLVMSAGLAFGQEEAKPELLPPLTGAGSDQTYMQAVWVIIIFVILLAILYPTAWKNVLAGLKKREERIRTDIAEAEAARAKADATLREYNAQLATAEKKVRDLMSQAATEAEKISAGIRMHAQQEAEEIKEKAIKDIDASRKQAIAEIYEQAANLSTSIAEKILRRNLNVDDQRELVNESLRQLQESSIS